MGDAAALSAIAHTSSSSQLSELTVQDLAALPIKQQADALFKLLAHDDRNSRYVIASRAADGTWTEQALHAGQPIEGFLAHYTEADWYLSHNGFTGTHRRSDKTRQVNAIMLDVDCHEGYSPEIVQALIARLTEAIRCNYLPSPTVCINTGRGAHLYYVLQRSTPARQKGGTPNEKGLSYVGDITRELAELVASVVDDLDGVEVDDSVYDLARVGRLPGTMNSATKTICHIFGGTGTLWTLADLGRYGLPSTKSSLTKNHTLQSRTRTLRAKRSNYALAEKNMLTHRLKMTSQLQRLRQYKCNGHRDQMCFVFYNTATQLFGPTHAKKMLETFNAAFSAPLPATDLRQIAKTIDQVVINHGKHRGEQGFYPLKKENVINRLGLSIEEDKALGFFENSKQRSRRNARQATINKKRHRDEEIVRLYSRCGLTQKEVAQRANCSLRTVNTVVAKLRLKRAKTWSLSKSISRTLKVKKNGYSLSQSQVNASKSKTAQALVGDRASSSAQIRALRVGGSVGPSLSIAIRGLVLPSSSYRSLDLLMSGSIMSSKSLSSAISLLSPISFSSTIFLSACLAFRR